MKILSKISCAALLSLLVVAASAEETEQYDASGNVVETLRSDQNVEYATYSADGEIMGARDADGKIIELNTEQDAQ